MDRSSVYYLSPNEFEKAVADERAHRRLARLAQVREQERVRAQLSRLKHQRSMEKKQESLNQVAESQFEAEKNTKLNELKAVRETLQSHFGEAHARAQQLQQKHVSLALEDVQSMRHAQVVEAQRFDEAVDVVYEDLRERQEEEEQRLEHLASIRVIEDYRAKVRTRRYHRKVDQSLRQIAMMRATAAEQSKFQDAEKQVGRGIKIIRHGPKNPERATGFQQAEDEKKRLDAEAQRKVEEQTKENKQVRERESLAWQKVEQKKDAVEVQQDLEMLQDGERKRAVRETLHTAQLIVNRRKVHELALSQKDAAKNKNQRLKKTFEDLFMRGDVEATPEKEKRIVEEYARVRAKEEEAERQEREDRARRVQEALLLEQQEAEEAARQADEEAQRKRQEQERKERQERRDAEAQPDQEELSRDESRQSIVFVPENARPIVYDYPADSEGSSFAMSRTDSRVSERDALESEAYNRRPHMDFDEHYYYETESGDEEEVHFERIEEHHPEDEEEESHFVKVVTEMIDSSTSTIISSSSSPSSAQSSPRQPARRPEQKYSATRPSISAAASERQGDTSSSLSFLDSSRTESEPSEVSDFDLMENAPSSAVTTPRRVASAASSASSSPIYTSASPSLRSPSSNVGSSSSAASSPVSTPASRLSSRPLSESPGSSLLSSPDSSIVSLEAELSDLERVTRRALAKGDELQRKTDTLRRMHLDAMERRIMQDAEWERLSDRSLLSFQSGPSSGGASSSASASDDEKFTKRKTGTGAAASASPSLSEGSLLSSNMELQAKWDAPSPRSNASSESSLSERALSSLLEDTVIDSDSSLENALEAFRSRTSSMLSSPASSRSTRSRRSSPSAHTLSSESMLDTDSLLDSSSLSSNPL